MSFLRWQFRSRMTKWSGHLTFLIEDLSNDPKSNVLQVVEPSANLDIWVEGITIMLGFALNTSNANLQLINNLLIHHVLYVRALHMRMTANLEYHVSPCHWRICSIGSSWRIHYLHMGGLAIHSCFCYMFSKQILKDAKQCILLLPQIDRQIDVCVCVSFKKKKS